MIRISRLVVYIVEFFFVMVILFWLDSYFFILFNTVIFDINMGIYFVILWFISD